MDGILRAQGDAAGSRTAHPCRDNGGAEATVASRLADLGFEPIGLDGAAFRRLFDDTVRTFAEIATERNSAASE
jgi:hypothetical protein